MFTFHCFRYIALHCSMNYIAVPCITLQYISGLHEQWGSKWRPQNTMVHNKEMVQKRPLIVGRPSILCTTYNMGSPCMKTSDPFRARFVEEYIHRKLNSVSSVCFGLLGDLGKVISDLYGRTLRVKQVPLLYVAEIHQPM